MNLSGIENYRAALDVVYGQWRSAMQQTSSIVRPDNPAQIAVRQYISVIDGWNQRGASLYNDVESVAWIQWMKAGKMHYTTLTQYCSGGTWDDIIDAAEKTMPEVADDLRSLGTGLAVGIGGLGLLAAAGLVIYFVVIGGKS